MNILEFYQAIKKDKKQNKAVDIAKKYLSENLKIMEAQIIIIIKQELGADNVIDASKTLSVPKSWIPLLFDETISIRNALYLLNKAENDKERIRILRGRASNKMLFNLLKMGTINEWTFFHTKNESTHNFYHSLIEKTKDDINHSEQLFNYHLDLVFYPIENIEENKLRLEVSLKILSHVYNIIKNHNSVYKFEKRFNVDEQNLIKKYEERFIEKINLTIDSIEYLLNKEKDIKTMNQLVDFFKILACAYQPKDIDLSEQKNKLSQLFMTTDYYLNRDKQKEETISLTLIKAFASFTGNYEHPILIDYDSDIQAAIDMEAPLPVSHLLIGYTPNKKFNLNNNLISNVIQYECENKYDFLFTSRLLEFVAKNSKPINYIDTKKSKTNVAFVNLASHLKAKLTNLSTEFAFDLFKSGSVDMIDKNELPDITIKLLKSGYIDKQQYCQMVQQDEKQHRLKMKKI